MMVYRPMRFVSKLHNVSKLDEGLYTVLAVPDKMRLKKFHLEMDSSLQSMYLAVRDCGRSKRAVNFLALKFGE